MEPDENEDEGMEVVMDDEDTGADLKQDEDIVDADGDEDVEDHLGGLAAIEEVKPEDVLGALLADIGE
jgi:hypothetical protein